MIRKEIFLSFGCLLGVEDNFSNQFGLTYAGILENWEVVENKVARIEVLMK